MDAISLRPAWVPFVSKASGEDHIQFNLRIMAGTIGMAFFPSVLMSFISRQLLIYSYCFFADDWQSERGFYTYFLGDPIHFEASVVIANHMPLRVYVDQCVATATPDADATLRYAFIDNYG